MRSSPFHALKRLFTSGWFVLLVAGVALVLAMGVGRLFVRRAAFNHEIAALQEERNSLSSSNQSYKNQLDYLSTEAFLEQEAREKFGQKRPGETAVYVEEESLSSVGDDSVNIEQFSKPQLWWMYFFDMNSYEAVRDAMASEL